MSDTSISSDNQKTVLKHETEEFVVGFVFWGSQARNLLTMPEHRELTQ